MGRVIDLERGSSDCSSLEDPNRHIFRAKKAFKEDESFNGNDQDDE